MFAALLFAQCDQGSGARLHAPVDPTPDEVVRDGRLSGYGGHVQEGGAQLELHLRPVTLLQVRTASEALHWGGQQVWRLDVYAQPGNGQDWPWPAVAWRAAGLEWQALPQIAAPVEEAGAPVVPGPPWSALFRLPENPMKPGEHTSITWLAPADLKDPELRFGETVVALTGITEPAGADAHDVPWIDMQGGRPR
ncbi:MAG: hypothetical protein R3F33_16065 [Planctomycetota bacterium]